MAKRRMPKLSQYIYDLNHETSLKFDQIPTVYASKNAELSRTFKIIRSFATDVSPTQFSMSVHNAIAGLLSVISKDTSTYTVIDSLSGALETAIIEALSLLSQHKFVKVIYFDEMMPEELTNEFPESQSIVLSLIIEKGQQFSLSHHHHETQEVAEKEDIKQLIDLLDHKKDHYNSCFNRLRWQWCRYD